MANLNSADILGVDWSRRARELLSSAGVKPSRQEGPSLRYEKVDPMAHMEPIVIKEKNAVTDPDSWLNRGLRTILENAADIILGKESGVPAVDYGASNIPGIGAASILAAGGIPGMLDVAGAGELKNILKGLKHGSKIGENAARFILRDYGEDALHAVDDYIDRFPKVGTIQVRDAYRILSEGRSGEIFLPNEVPPELSPERLLSKYYFRTPPRDGQLTFENFEEKLKEKIPSLQHIDMLILGLARDAAADGDQYYINFLKENDPKRIQENILGTIGKMKQMQREGDITGQVTLMHEIMGAYHSPDALRKVVAQVANDNDPHILKAYRDRLESYAKTNRGTFDISAFEGEDADNVRRLNDYIITQYGTSQPLEEIEAKQLRNEANKAAKKQKAAEKQMAAAQKQMANKPTKANVEKAVATSNESDRIAHEAEMAKIAADRARYEKNLEKRAEENRKITQEQQAAAEAAKASAPTASNVLKAAVDDVPVRTTWRDTWSPDGHDIDYESILGKKALTDDEKRDAFVLDSLANVWANQLRTRQPEEWPGSAAFRHDYTNYGVNRFHPGVADRFVQDIKHNVNIGNTPGTSFTLHRPKGVDNPVARAIDVEGYDIYYPLFHKKVDKKLKELESRYYFDPFDPKYDIKNYPQK